jgi:hypothetical protein
LAHGMSLRLRTRQGKRDGHAIVDRCLGQSRSHFPCGPRHPHFLPIETLT